jgi:DNA-binding transcriptional ArsR family regulator
MEKYNLMFIYGLLGETVSKLLLYINRFKESYATEMAEHFSMSQQTVRYNAEKLEGAGILKSRLVGKTRLYRINPRYVLRNELSLLLEKALQYMPDEIMDNFYVKRTRPRTRGKELRKFRDGTE